MTPRQKEAADLYLAGKEVPEVAEAMGIVESRVRALLREANVTLRTRGDAVARAPGVAINWPEDRVASLKKLHAEGLSMSQIARRLGHGLSRSAVLGKIHRLGLARPEVAKPIRYTPGRPAKAPKPSPGPTAAATNVIHLKPPTPVRPERPHKGPVVPMAQLQAHMCKWPIGDPQDAGFGFCGAKRQGALPYCDAHIRRAYQAGTALGRRDTAALRVPRPQRRASV